MTFWVLASSECRHMERTEPGYEAGDKCLFPRCNTRLKNNQVESRKMVYNPQNGKSDDKSVVVVVKIVQLGCVSQDSEPSELPKSLNWSIGKNPRHEVFGPIRGVRFTQSTLREASIREKKVPSLEKIQVKNPHQHSPYATKICGQISGTDWKTTAMRPKQGMTPCQNT